MEGTETEYPPPRGGCGKVVVSGKDESNRTGALWQARRYRCASGLRPYAGVEPAQEQRAVKKTPQGFEAMAA